MDDDSVCGSRRKRRMDIITAGRMRNSLDQDAALLPILVRHVMILCTSMTESIVKRHVAPDTETGIETGIGTGTAPRSAAGSATCMVIEREIRTTRFCATMKGRWNDTENKFVMDYTVETCYALENRIAIQSVRYIREGTVVSKCNRIHTMKIHGNVTEKERWSE